MEVVGKTAAHQDAVGDNIRQEIMVKTKNVFEGEEIFDELGEGQIGIGIKDVEPQVVGVVIVVVMAGLGPEVNKDFTRMWESEQVGGLLNGLP